jgi:2,3-bisphosphoglycerate-independent phosphoglycerate mutase
MRRKILLLIMDGVGVAPRGPGNAVTLAKPLNLIRLWDTYPHTYLEASGEHVGLAQNTNGNSEVGHLTIGSGKVNYQNLLKINNAINKDLFFQNQTLKEILYHSQKNNSNIHLMGCLSDGAVHSHISHFIATLKFFAINNFKGNIFFHIFTDGRDVPPKSAATYLQKLDEAIQEYRIGKIASLCGRAYAMDRNNIWDRTQKIYDLLVFGKGYTCINWRDAIEQAYQRGEIDEYIEPTIISSGNRQDSIIQDSDAVLFLNFRPDRAIQLSKALKNTADEHIQGRKFNNLFFVGMVEYEKDFPTKILFPKEYVALPIGRIISEAGYRQLRIAESDKYPHITYFLNGGLPLQYAREDRIQIPSPKVKTYDMKPEMSAIEIMDTLIPKLDKKNDYSFIATNLANVDLVGHTGNIEAGIKAVKIVDYVVEKIVRTALSHNWTIILTADHGNAERMIDTKTGQILTEHTQNPVPMFIISNEIKDRIKKRLSNGSLCDIAPTILKLMGIGRPSAMIGKVLIS